MKPPLPRRSNLFLLELILAIFFFSLAAAVCMQLFVKARSLSDQASLQNHALVEAKNACALFRTHSGSLEALQEEYPSSVLTAASLEVYYDEAWELCEPESSLYTMEIRTDASDYEGRLVLGEVSVSAKEELCTLTASSYTAQKAGDPSS